MLYLAHRAGQTQHAQTEKQDENGQGIGSDGKPIFDEAGYSWHDYHVELLSRRPVERHTETPDVDRKNQAFDDWYDE